MTICNSDNVSSTEALAFVYGFVVSRARDDTELKRVNRFISIIEKELRKNNE